MEPTYCRCCGTELGGSDHCPACFCEEFEENCRPRGENARYNRETGEREEKP